MNRRPYRRQPTRDTPEEQEAFLFYKRTMGRIALFAGHVADPAILNALNEKLLEAWDVLEAAGRDPPAPPATAERAGYATSP